MDRKRAEEAFRPIKPTSVHTQTEKSDAMTEYRAERQATIDRMARQREARLSAGALVKMKNDSG